MDFFNKNKYVSLLVFLLVIGAFLRFYNLNWGAPFYFHPDERNMAMSISQMSFPNQLHPNFFAYGSLPLYSIFLTGILNNFFTTCQHSFTSCQVSFEQAIIISRIYTALFSVLLIPLMAYIGTKLYGRTAGVLTAALTTFSVGFIQFAHFGTTEMWLTFFSTLLFYLTYTLLQKYSKTTILLIGFVLGILAATKISSLVLLPLPFLALLLSVQKMKQASFSQKTGQLIISYLSIMLITASLYVASNPFVLLDFKAFQESMTYETTLAQGILPVFYTQEFFETTPILFQFLHIYPFLMNPVMTILMFPAFVMITYRILKYKDAASLLVVIFFLLLFLSQAFLFVKWTRYMLPTLPFLYLIMIGAADTIAKQRFFFLRSSSFRYSVSIILLCICSIFAFSYVQTVYAENDTRVQAAAFAAQNLPTDAFYLSEVYDLGITPFNSSFSKITLFNFYDLDANVAGSDQQTLNRLKQEADYIIVPSQRVYKTRILQPEKFPLGHMFYQDLEAGKEYKKIYETPCPLFCLLTYLGNPIFSYETTASVFDRPTVMIFEKM